MQTYIIDSKKRKKALKKCFKIEVKKAGWFARFCYALTVFFRVMAILLGIANIVYCAVWSRFPELEILFLPVTAGLPYAFSYIPSAACSMLVCGEYWLRRKEAVCVTGNGFTYGYHDDRDLFTNSIFEFEIMYSNIQKLEYDEKCKLLTIYGPIPGATYVNGKREPAETCYQLSLLNVYDIDIVELLKTKWQTEEEKCIM